MNYRKHFVVVPDKPVHLGKFDPGFKGDHKDRAEVEPLIEHNRQQLARLQLHLYAERRRSVLICLQGMDAAGKDGLITHILGSMNPLGCRVASFKQPTGEEVAHDFLWRVHRQVPGRGWVGIFNRSHYEAVLVERVHELVPEHLWRKRYDQIKDFERLLANNDTVVIKLFLHISRDEQLVRFKERLDDPGKRWKISEADYAERELWDEYAAAYTEALGRCSTEHAPWYVIPSNHKWFRDLVASQIIVETLEDLRIAEPKPTVDIGEIRRKYHQASSTQP